MTTLSSPSLLGPLFSSAAMRALMEDRARLQRMLDFEAALARAEAEAGVIPAKAAGPIAQACRAERFDLGQIAEDAALALVLVVVFMRPGSHETKRSSSSATER